jgi:hypothetical protein
VPRAVNRQQDVLHNVISAVARYIAPSRNIFDKRHALAQQFFIRRAVASLGSDHQSRPSLITFRDGLVWNRLCHCLTSYFSLENRPISRRASNQRGSIDTK